MLHGVSLVSTQRATAILSTPMPPGIYEVSARLDDETAVLAGGFTILEKSSSHRSDGCGCRVGRVNARTPWAALMALLGLALYRSRRRLRPRG